MNNRKRLLHCGSSSAEKAFCVQPRTFIFFDRITGTQRFEVRANADGTIPADHAASLLAVQCLVRGQAPKDFVVMIAPDENVLGTVSQRATKLVEACQGARLSAVSLTVRQKEVLRGILQSFSNKEIGNKLNVTERTVKFHVSTLLSKFDVSGRVGLMRRVTDLLSAGKISLGLEAPQFAAAEQLGAPAARPREHQVHIVTLKKVSRG